MTDFMAGLAQFLVAFWACAGSGIGVWVLVGRVREREWARRVLHGRDVCLCGHAAHRHSSYLCWENHCRCRKSKSDVMAYASELRDAANVGRDVQDVISGSRQRRRSGGAA